MTCRGDGHRIGVIANQFCCHQQRNLRKVLESQISNCKMRMVVIMYNLGCED